MLQDNDEYYLFAKELKSQGHSMAKIEKELRLNNLDDGYIRAIKHKLAGMEHGGSSGISKHFTPYTPSEPGNLPAEEGIKTIKKGRLTWRNILIFIILYAIIKAVIRLMAN